jgi:hypothetical protein
MQGCSLGDIQDQIIGGKCHGGALVIRKPKSLGGVLILSTKYKFQCRRMWIILLSLYDSRGNSIKVVLRELSHRGVRDIIHTAIQPKHSQELVFIPAAVGFHSQH